MAHINIEDLKFESVDETVFKIKDRKTRLDTLQNYFFPRFEVFIENTMRIVNECYGIDFREKYTFVYRPAHRKDASVNKDYGEVRMGISAKRDFSKTLRLFNKKGEQSVLNPFRLTLVLTEFGEMYVTLHNHGEVIGNQFLSTVAAKLGTNLEILESILSSRHIKYLSSDFRLSLPKMFDPNQSEQIDVEFSSASVYLPVSYERGIFDLTLVFVALFPILHFLTLEAEGAETDLGGNLQKFYSFYTDDNEVEDEDDIESDNDSETKLNEGEEDDDDTHDELVCLDNYRFVRPSIRWDVFARDKWKCCACGISAAKDGVTLEVDHVKPRSLGGSDSFENLQTLCRKCNIGKSNRDETNLRST